MRMSTEVNRVNVKEVLFGRFLTEKIGMFKNVR